MHDSLGRLVTLLDLLELHAGAYWRLSSLVGQLMVRLETSIPPVDQFAVALQELRKEANRLGAESAVRQIDRINDLFMDEEWKSYSELANRLKPLVTDLHLRMNDELAGRFF